MKTTNDITRITLGVLFIAILIGASFWIMRPFITSIVWALIIVVATWPVMLAIQERLFGKRGLAVAAMTIILLMVVIVPSLFAVSTIMDNAENIADRIKTLSAAPLPQPPGWIEGIPVVGQKLAVQWQTLAAISPDQLSEKLAPYAKTITAWFLSKAGSVGMTVVEFLLTVIIAAIMYSGGETASAGVLRFARRLAGERGEEVIVLAARAIKGVALGIVVTAVIQTGLAGAGLLISGVPAAPILTAVVFMLCIAQVGPLPVMAPAVAWLYWKDDPLWGTVLLVFTLISVTIDNVIRPILIKKGVDLSLIMIFAGVLGGLVAFGVIGLFIGPVVLAVSFTLLKSWVEGEGVTGNRPVN